MEDIDIKQEKEDSVEIAKNDKGIKKEDLSDVEEEAMDEENAFLKEPMKFEFSSVKLENQETSNFLCEQTNMSSILPDDGYCETTKQEDPLATNQCDAQQSCSESTPNPSTFFETRPVESPEGASSHHMDQEVDEHPSVKSGHLTPDGTSSRPGECSPRTAVSTENDLDETESGDDSFKYPECVLSEFSETDVRPEYCIRIQRSKSVRSGGNNSITSDDRTTSPSSDKPNGFHQELTTKRVIKRKKYETSVEERKQSAFEEKVKRHKVDDTCSCTIKKCSSKISSEQREVINSEYWSFSKNEQQIYVSSHISTAPVQRRRSVSERRNLSVTYFMRDGQGEMQEVCKKFFLTTLGYNPKNDKVITNVLRNLQDFGVPFSEDHRGTNPKKKFDRELIRKHVESFSPTLLDVSEHAPNKRYLPGDLTIKTMYEDFVKSNSEKCSYDLYRKFVTEDLNISFANLGHE